MLKSLEILAINPTIKFNKTTSALHMVYIVILTISIPGNFAVKTMVNNIILCDGILDPFVESVTSFYRSLKYGDYLFDRSELSITKFMKSIVYSVTLSR